MFAVTSGIALLTQETPSSYIEAMVSPKRMQWRIATQAEFDGCVAQHTWVLVKRSDLPGGTNVIPVKWVFKIKTDENGVITKYKARITPKGFKQRYGIDYFEVFANTGKYKTLRILLSIAARRDLELRQYDVPQAFTQAGLDEDVYMEMPEGFEVEGMVCHLKKSLYGLKQSPRNWWLLCSAFIIEKLGYRSTASDPCLFWKKSRTGQLMLLFLFVDDMQVAFDKTDELEWQESHLQLKERFNITDLGESRFMLGMRITRDRRARTIKLDQELYITTALERFGLQQCKSVPTPAAAAAAIVPENQIEIDQPTDVKLYQEKVGTLLYAAISTRPDIAFAVNKLAQQMQSPTTAHAKSTDRVFRYLAATKSKGMLFGRRCIEDYSLKNQEKKSHQVGNIITAYADADWGSDPTDRKSITGWIVMVDGDPVSWACKKQKVVSQSSCEAELYAEAAAINEIKWLRGLLEEVGLIDSSAAALPVAPPILYGDNQSTQELSRHGIKSERTKHIDIKYRFVTDEVSSGRIELKWISTTQQVADVLTKALGTQQHRTLIDRLMV